MKALLAGWFSFELMGATAGDLMTRDVVSEWLTRAGRPHDIAVAPPFTGGVDWRDVVPSDYSDVVFVCGPIGNGPPVDEFLARFSGCRLSGLNLSMLHRIEEWNPFELLWERDSNLQTRPDMAFLAHQAQVPMVGVVLVHPQREYKGGLHQEANAALERLTASREMVRVPIDTRLDVNRTALRSAREIETAVARMDVVVTTRLHGTVLALKNGVPVVAVDPIVGGAKIKLQAKAIGWPVVLTADAITDENLRQAFDFCLTSEARRLAVQCRERAVTQVSRVRDEFIAAMIPNPTSPLEVTR